MSGWTHYDVNLGRRLETSSVVGLGSNLDAANRRVDEAQFGPHKYFKNLFD